MKGMLKLGLVLSLYAMAACVGLAFVHTSTAEQRDKQSRKGLEAALREIFPGMDGLEDISGALPSPGGAVSFAGEYKILRGNEVIGLAIRATGPGYGGPLTLIAGINAGGTVRGVKILEHQETPGLGANAASSTYFVDKAKKITFSGQFAGKALTDPFEVKNDVQAITAATVTSYYVTNLVKTAALAAGAWFSGDIVP